MTIYFYSSHEEPYGCFSNFSEHGFEFDGLYWATVEHYFQAHKFAGNPYTKQIRTAKTPKQAKELGRTREHPLRSDWEDVKVDLMRQAVLRKFQTHADIRTILLDTGNEEIVENSADAYWGSGSDGSGENMLGLILMETRDILNQDI